MSKLIKEFELADWLRQSISTIRRNRTAAPHRHPPYKKVGSSVLYDIDEVQRWIDSKTVNGLDTPSSSSGSLENPVRHRGRPNKAETVRKTKNADR